MSAGIDLKADVDGFGAVPHLAADLHLKHFFGGESIDVPVTITNIGTERAHGNARVTLYLSTTPDMSEVVTQKELTTVEQPIGADDRREGVAHGHFRHASREEHFCNSRHWRADDLGFGVLTVHGRLRNYT